MIKKIKCIAILGPTASGKTSLSINLAQRYDGEVISVDSRQVYRNLDIGTAKITKTEMENVPHHLIDVVDINDIYTAEKFKTDATDTIFAINSREHIPILTGGTFFYFDILRGKMSTAPVTPMPELREKLESQSTDSLRLSLKTKDSNFYEKVDKNNRRRLIRAIEIFENLGYIPEERKDNNNFIFFTVALYRHKEELRERYKNRAIEWLENGFQKEVEDLLEIGVNRSRLQEIGFEYRLMLSYIDGYITTRNEFVEKFVQKNWQYAKRQYTWLRKDGSINWYHPVDIKEIYTDIDYFLNKEQDINLQ